MILSQRSIGARTRSERETKDDKRQPAQQKWGPGSGGNHGGGRRKKTSEEKAEAKAAKAAKLNGRGRPRATGYL